MAAPPDAAIRLRAAPAEIRSGKTVDVTGAVIAAAGAPAGGAPLELQTDPFPYRGFFDAGHTAAAADGTFAFKGLRPDRNTRYRVRSAAGLSPAVTVYVDAPAVLRSSDRGPGRAVLTMLARHSAYFRWAGARAAWFVAPRGSRRFQLAAVTRAADPRPGLTSATATVDPPARRFDYRVCLSAPGESGAGPPAPRGLCPPGDVEYQAAGQGTPRPAYPPPQSVDDAARFLAGRSGRTAFAVIDDKGALSGARVHQRFYSASVVKAMLLVAYLERLSAENRGLDPDVRDLLYPMIHVSDNDAASAVFAIVGQDGLRSVADQAGMTDFDPSPDWVHTLISAADQARFFLVQDRLIPPQFDGYARDLLSGIAADQSWGVPAAARPRFRVFFKGGWLPSIGLVNQSARLEAPGTTFAMAVLTTGEPSMFYGEETIFGVAARVIAVLRPS